MADEGQRWQDYRKPCGHLINWSEEMTEWTHQETQDKGIHSITFVKYPDQWFWIPAVKACEMTDFLNAQQQELARLRQQAAPFYLPMDCPACGRARLEVFPLKKRMKCEKCGVEAFDCDEAVHEAGGPHHQWPTEALQQQGGR